MVIACHFTFRATAELASIPLEELKRGERTGKKKRRRMCVCVCQIQSVERKRDGGKRATERDKKISETKP